MSDTNLHKFDMKGNLIKEWVPLFTGGAFDAPSGIEFDHDGLWIVAGDLTDFTGTYVYNYDKKGNLIRSFALPSKTELGITTDGKVLTVSTADGAMEVLDKKGNLIKNVTPGGGVYYTLSFNGVDLLGQTAGSLKVDYMEPKTYNIKRQLANISYICNGVCAIGNKIATFENGTDLQYYDFKGNLITTIALPTGGGARYYPDLCYDEEFLWMISVE